MLPIIVNDDKIPIHRDATMATRRAAAVERRIIPHSPSQKTFFRSMEALDVDGCFVRQAHRPSAIPQMTPTPRRQGGSVVFFSQEAQTRLLLP